jgi:hypothetical protein
MYTEGCESCSAMDFETVHASGVYACHACKTLFWMVSAREPAEKVAEADAAADAFLAAREGWDLRG